MKKIIKTVSFLTMLFLILNHHVFANTNDVVIVNNEINGTEIDNNENVKQDASNSESDSLNKNINLCDDPNSIDRAEKKDEKSVSTEVSIKNNLKAPEKNKEEENNESEEIEEEKIIPKSSQIEEGTYIIESCIKKNMILDVTGASKNNGASIELWQDNRGKNQRYEIKKVDDDYYKIIALHSKKALTAESEEMSNGVNIQQYDYQEKDTQKWIIIQSESGIVNFVCPSNGLCIDANGAVAENGTNIQLWKPNNSGAQSFKLKRIDIEKQERLEKLEDGMYYINSAININMTCDVNGASKNNGANITLWKKNKGANQQFEIKYQDGYYTMKVVHSGKYIDSHDSGMALGTNIEQYEYNGGDNQKWIIKDVGNGFFSIISKYCGLYIDANGGIASNGTNIQLWEGNGTKGQKFRISKVKNDIPTKTIEDGTYQIKSALSDSKVIDIEGGSKNNCANAILWQNKDGLNQQFNIRYLGDGYYSIICVNSGKSLDVKSLGKKNGTNVEQYYFNLGDNQKWIIQQCEYEEDSFNIISKCNNLFLDINGAYDGSNIYMWEENGNNTQKFKFSKIESKSERCIPDGTYEIESSKNPNMVIDVTGASIEEDTNIELWQRNNGKNQKFKFTYNDGSYTIEAEYSKRVLSVENNNVIQKTLGNSKNQKWIIQNNGNERYNIISLSNGLYMEIEKGINSGSNINVNERSNNGLQLFNIKQVKKITVVINPGHGGKEPGCIGVSGLMEKTITLRIAQYVRDELNKSANFNVILTHEGLDDWYEMPLADRAQIARDNNADVYVSLHINAEPSDTASGSMVFVPYYEGERHYNSSMSRLGNLIQNWLEKIGITKFSDKAITKRCNDHDSRYQYLENGAVVQADYYADIRHAMKGSTLGYGADLNINTGIPAILVEHCFINTDTVFVQNDDALRRVAVADANAIREFFETN